MKYLLLTISLLTAAALPALAQDANVNIHLKDGRVITVPRLQRSGGDIMVSATSGPAGGQVGYSVSSIDRIDFPEPAQLQGANNLFADGKISEGVAQLQPVLDYYAPFRDIQGSWWTKGAVMEVNALVNAGREKDAGPLIAQLEQITSDPEATCIAEVLQAADWARDGRYTLAMPQFEDAIKKSANKDTLALAWYNKGYCMLALRHWEDAAIAYLRIPVFYPNNKVLVPPSLLGSAHAMVGMQDYAGAKKELQDLISQYPNSPEAEPAKAELEKLNKQEPEKTAG